MDTLISVCIVLEVSGALIGSIVGVLAVKHSVQQEHLKKIKTTPSDDVKIIVQVGQSRSEFITRSTGNLERDVRQGAWEKVREEPA